MLQTRMQLQDQWIKKTRWIHSTKKRYKSNIRCPSSWIIMVKLIKTRFKVSKKVYYPLQVSAGSKWLTQILGSLFHLGTKISKILKTMSLFYLITIRTRRLFHLLTSKTCIILRIIRGGRVLIRLIRNHQLMISIWPKIIKTITKLSRIRIAKHHKNSFRNFIIKKIRKIWITLKLLWAKIKMKVINLKRIYLIKKNKNQSKVKIRLKEVNYLFQREKS
jgi:hypothetical protein